MAVRVNTCLRGFGCNTFPHTCTHSLASPSQAKPSQGVSSLRFGVSELDSHLRYMRALVRDGP